MVSSRSAIVFSTVLAALCASSPALAGTGTPTISKVAGTGSVIAGDGITYTITYDPVSLADSVEITDALPADLLFTSLVAPGTFTCTTPTPGTSGLVDCDATSLAPGSYVFTLNVATSFDTPSGPLANTVNSTAQIGGGPQVASDTETVNVTAGSTFSATKTVSGTFVVGGTVTYTVVLTNNGPLSQSDNAGDEFTDVLPAGLALVSANATAGTPLANLGTNTVTWNGALAPGASVTITIQATIGGPGTFSNQGGTSFDRNNNGINETAGVTDDPTVGGPADPTVFSVSGAGAQVPTLGGWGLLALGGLLAAAGWAALRRR